MDKRRRWGKLGKLYFLKANISLSSEQEEKENYIIPATSG
jgi:hypothetical protein